MWEVIKILVGALVILAISVPIFRLLGKIAGVFADVIHRGQLARAEQEAAWSKTRKGQLSWHSPDDKGFTGIVHDAANNVWYNLDTGERWADDGSPVGRPDRSRRAVHDKQRLLAAGRSSAKPPAPPLAMVNVRTGESELNEPSTVQR